MAVLHATQSSPRHACSEEQNPAATVQDWLHLNAQHMQHAPFICLMYGLMHSALMFANALITAPCTADRLQQQHKNTRHVHMYADMPGCRWKICWHVGNSLHALTKHKAIVSQKFSDGTRMQCVDMAQKCTLCVAMHLLAQLFWSSTQAGHECHKRTCMHATHSHALSLAPSTCMHASNISLTEG